MPLKLSKRAEDNSLSTTHVQHSVGLHVLSFLQEWDIFFENVPIWFHTFSCMHSWISICKGNVNLRLVYVAVSFVRVY